MIRDAERETADRRARPRRSETAPRCGRVRLPARRKAQWACVLYIRSRPIHLDGNHLPFQCRNEEEFFAVSTPPPGENTSVRRNLLPSLRGLQGPDIDFVCPIRDRAISQPLSIGRKLRSGCGTHHERRFRRPGDPSGPQTGSGSHPLEENRLFVRRPSQRHGAGVRFKDSFLTACTA
jgi:hypothetical protein